MYSTLKATRSLKVKVLMFTHLSGVTRTQRYCRSDEVWCCIIPPAGCTCWDPAATAHLRRWDPLWKGLRTFWHRGYRGTECMVHRSAAKGNSTQLTLPVVSNVITTYNSSSAVLVCFGLFLYVLVVAFTAVPFLRSIQAQAPAWQRFLRSPSVCPPLGLRGSLTLGRQSRHQPPQVLGQCHESKSSTFWLMRWL